jgi:Fur family zinc uptake transcriptional regulator
VVSRFHCFDSLPEKVCQQEKIKKTILKAKGVCDRAGTRFTKKRARIFKIMLQADIPLSAYEIADLYNQSSNEKMPPMSVYRILQFFVSLNLVHKLSLNNKYVTCSHISCDHTHEAPQFLLCNNCAIATEISMSSKLLRDLKKLVKNAGFALINPQLEFQCLCDTCYANSKISLR